MSSLKSHLSLILALTSIMISIFLFETFSSVLHKYEKNIVDNYSIIVVSSSMIENIPFDDVASIKQIDISKEINKLKKEYKNIDFNGITLPYFYQIKFNYLPSPSKLIEIKNELLQEPNIQKVMTKSSSQTKIYNLLLLLKVTSKLFMFLVGVLGFFLIIKQLEVWKLIHSERMYIMELFGAPFWFRGAALFKIAFIDSLFSIITSMGIILYITNEDKFTQIINQLNIDFSINYFEEFIFLFIISLTISIVSSIIVVMTGKQ